MKIIIILLLIFSVAGSVFYFFKSPPMQTTPIPNLLPQKTSSPLPNPTPSYKLPGDLKIIPLKTHIFQSFNNCGPAALAMALSYFNISKNQQELGNKLRPYQIPGGNNDDKSVTLEELANEAENLGLVSYHRPNGDIEKLKLFIANDIPVITRTLLKLNEDIGHYRIVRGFDETSKVLIQDDSLQNKNLKYSYFDFLYLWETFNFEYLVIAPTEKKELVEDILGDELDRKVAFQNSLVRIGLKDSKNYHIGFNKSIIYYHLGDYQKSAEEFEKVESQLTFRTLWYQIEPILAYQKLKDYQRVFKITEQIFNNHNRAFSELYQIRGEIYLEKGNVDAAKVEFEKALLYNKNSTKTNEALKMLN